MAAVTLANLMDPLSKIEAAAQQTNEKLDALIAVATGGSSGGGGMDVVKAIQEQTNVIHELDNSINRDNTLLFSLLEEQTGLLFRIAENTQRIDEKSGKSLTNFLFTRAHRKKLLSAVSKKPEKGGGDAAAAGGGGKLADLKALGIGSIKTAMGMILWAVVPKKGVEKFANFIETTFTKLAEQDSKKVKEGIESLDMMGGAIFKFAKSLALATPLLLIGALGIPILYLTTILVTPLFLLLGMALDYYDDRKTGQTG